MSNKEILRKLLSLSIPFFINTSLSSILSFSDSLILSLYDQYALAASLSVGLIINVFTILFYGLIGYSSNFIGKSYGSKDPISINIYFSASIFISICSFALFFILQEYFFVKFLGIFTQPIQQINNAIKYMKVMRFSPLFGFLLLSFSSYNNAINKQLVSMRLNIFGILINIILDLILINGIRIKNIIYINSYGIEGAAYATIIAQVSVFIIYLYLFRKQRDRPSFSFSIFKEKIFTILKKGIFVGFEHFFYLLANTFVINYLQGIYLQSYVTISIAFAIDRLSFLPFNSLSSADSILVSTLIGEGEIKSIKKLLRISLVLSFIIALLIFFIYMFFSEPICKLFLSSEINISNLEQSIKLTKILSIKLIFDSIGMIIWGILRGAGDTKCAFLISIISNLLRLLTIIFIIFFLKYDNIYVLWIINCSMIGLLPLFGICRYISMSWRKVLIE
jgi:MATE family multidrug resistance protein